MTRHEKRDLMVRAEEATRDVLRIWGAIYLGIPLVSKFYSDDPWATARELAEGLEASEDTVRRRLDRLVLIGRAKSAKRGRFTVYKAHRDFAERTVQIVNKVVSNA